MLTFDEDAAAVNGLPVRWLNIAVTVLTALVISVAIKIVGALLVSALLTIPVATSLLLAKSFKGRSSSPCSCRNPPSSPGCSWQACGTWRPERRLYYY